MINPLQPDYQNSPVSNKRPAFLYQPANPIVFPQVSILTPFFNTGDVFHETAQSVFMQSFQNWEWLIINDGSLEPNALAILESYRTIDPRVKVIDHPTNMGLSSARNTGFRISRSEYCVLLDSDDLLEPTALEKWFWFLNSYPEYSFVKGYNVGFGGQEYLWQKGFHNTVEFLEENLVDATCMIRRSVHQAVGGFEENNRLGLEDWDFWLKCAANGHWGNTIPEFLNWYRRRITHTDRWENLKDNRINQFREQLKKRYPELWRGGFPRISPEDHKPFQPFKFLPDDNRLVKEKPRLLMIVPWLTMGGADKFNVDVLKYVTTAGWEVSIVATTEGNNSWQHEFASWTPDIFILPHFLKYCDFPSFLRHIINSRQIDLVYVSNSEIGYMLLPFLRSVFPDLPIVDYCHMEEEHWNAGGHPRASVQHQNQTNLNIVSSNHLKNWMIARSADPGQIEVCYTCIDSESWKPIPAKKSEIRRKWNLPDKTPILLYVGRVVEQKQPLVFADTMERLSQSVNNFRAVVVGTGPDLDPLKHAINSRGLIDVVSFTGETSNEMVKELMTAGDTLFLPSQWEGIALTIYEAMACGLAIVGADVGGQRELVTPDCGFLIRRSSPAEEAQEYASILSSLVSNEEIRSRMGAASRQRILDHFQIEKMGSRMLALFEIAISRKEGSEKKGISKALGLSCAHYAIEYSVAVNQVYKDNQLLKNNVRQWRKLAEEQQHRIFALETQLAIRGSIPPSNGDNP